MSPLGFRIILSLDNLCEINQVPNIRRTIILFTEVSGGFLNNSGRTAAIIFEQFDGFCLEAQHFRDSVNQPPFPPTILMPDEVYGQTTIHKFLSS